MSARSTAIARADQEIEESTERAVAARETERKPQTALAAMAHRLQISQTSLISTLKATAFRGASDDEFAALVVVANEYRLNPLLKEIYAFPAKGGIVPMVSVDGWISLMNRQPNFDGIEFEYTNNDKGQTEAIESIIYLKDRTHPVKVMEYMDECKRNTEPWNKSPRRMLRHRALIQGARVAFGFSGIIAEDDEVIEGSYTVRADVPALPSRQALTNEPETHDPETGEVERDARGMTEVDEDTARELDAEPDTITEDQRTELIGLFEMTGVPVGEFLQAGNVTDLREVPFGQFESAKRWISNRERETA